MAGAPCPVEVMKKVIQLMHMSKVTVSRANFRLLQPGTVLREGQGATPPPSPPNEIFW